MKCPTDDTLLVMSDRSGIEIDYCPQCRGVWLDRGELDKIIERASTAPAPAAAPRVELPRETPARPAGGYPPGGYAQPGYPQRWGSNSPGSAPRYGGGYGHPGGSYKRPKNWLSELFD
ncbi:zf-TFIIB domain-containing protein [Microcella sp.]|jgi:Zn-finger nucleic acid-binding protein|uniref:TFIIB-type zinc ribbon-containing protein n=1 Tax=Microcella sp. TaxID=1913979 RepID=UPI00391C9BEE